jgi:biotin operon repressor
VALYRRSHAADHFTQVPNVWVRDGKTRPNGKAVLFVLLSHDAGYRLSIAQVSRETGLGRDAVHTAITHLLDRGYLTEVRQPRQAQGRFAENDYELTDCWDRVPDEARHVPDQDGSSQPAGNAGTASGSTGTADPHVSSAIRADQPVRSDPAPADPAPAGPDQRRTQGEQRRENTIPLPLSSPEEHRPRPVDRFEEWYALYPRKEGKGAARKAWASACRRADAEKIIEITRRYPFDPDRSRIRYTKTPAAWLNGDCWEDDLVTVAAANRPGRGSGARVPHEPSRDPDDYEPPRSPEPAPSAAPAASPNG